MKKSYASFILLLSVLACSDEESTHSGVNIRITNASSFDYYGVYVNTTGGQFNFGNVKSSHSSIYHEFDSAYGYASMTMTVNNKEARLIPIDYVGEQKLPPGNYTYKVTIQQNGDDYWPDITLIKD
jgi:hypothetical protein